MGLKYDEVFKEYSRQVKEYGGSSCDSVATILRENGVFNLLTDKQYTRQAIRMCLSRTPEGRALLEIPAKRHHKNKSALIVEYRNGIREWLVAKMPDIEVNLSPSVAEVEGRYVYGDIPSVLAVHCASVWLVVVEGEPVVAQDATAAQLDEAKADLREFKVRRVK